MRGCELIFTPDVAQKVQRTISEQMGGMCPCDVGQRCPLLPDDPADLLVPKHEDEVEHRLVPIGPRKAVEDTADPNAAANLSLGLRLKLIAEEAREAETA